MELQQSLDKMMERGGFNLTKWASNSKEVLSHIAEQEQAESITTDFNASEPGKVLGMSRNTSTGCLLFSIPASVLTANDPETKRSLLSITSKVFDPIGLITPLTIRAKMLFQELWQRGLQWEDRLDDDIADQWRSSKLKLSQLTCITVPRYFMGNFESSSSIVIHGFGDASTKAYGAAVHIWCVNEAGHISTHLVMSKSRSGSHNDCVVAKTRVTCRSHQCKITEVRCRILNTQKRSGSVLDRKHGDSPVDQRFSLSVEDIRSEPLC